MAYSSLQQCVLDLERNGHLRRVKFEIDPNLELAEIQRRLYQAQGPAVLFENVKGSPFPALANLFGTMDRARFLFRDTIPTIQKVMELKANPPSALKKPFRYLGLPFAGLKALPKKKFLSSAPVLAHQTRLSLLPQIKSWPMDGGPFITLPQVCTEPWGFPGPAKANLGMYRVQLAGNQYLPDKQIGLHYQIHRGIGVHHAGYIQAGKKMPVSIFVGGPPSHTFSAVMPLPEGLSELMFAGMLGNRRFRWTRWKDYLISADADFCIVGMVDTQLMTEGPFGDHLGYYSLEHLYPFLEIEAVFHRKNAIWPFTVVGRPPQEDTTFGELIHELTAPVVPSEIPGLHAMHAVDAAGVHPLLLAIGSERYLPYAQERQPQEILTIANAILGFGQASLAKYLLISAHEDNPKLDIHHIPSFFQHILERVDWTRDLHFQTNTTIDTLDYSGMGYNLGSKVVIAAAGPARRTLNTQLEGGFSLPAGFSNPRVVGPGILAVQGPEYRDPSTGEPTAQHLAEFLTQRPELGTGFPLWILGDDSEFISRNWPNFLWVTFTRSNPSHDLYGAGAFFDHKHWGCTGPLLIDARIKPHHAPPLVEDPKVSRRVDALASKGGPLEGLF